MLVRLISQKPLGTTDQTHFLSLLLLSTSGGETWLPLTLEEPHSHLSWQHEPRRAGSPLQSRDAPAKLCSDGKRASHKHPPIAGAGSKGQHSAGDISVAPISGAKERGRAYGKVKDINVGPWGERLRIPSCLLICKPCQRLSILSEHRKEETDAEIITTLAKNLFLYPEGELRPHSCLQDGVKAFSPWYIAMAINFLDQLKLTFILKRKVTCCTKHLPTWHLPRTME